MSGSHVETIDKTVAEAALAGRLASGAASGRLSRVVTLVLLRDSLLSALLLGALGALILAVPVVGQLLAF